MTDGQYAEIILRGHLLYWDMLGSLRGNANHVEDELRWLSGDLTYTYFTGSVAADAVIARMQGGEIPKNLLFPHGMEECAAAEALLASGRFRKCTETVGMAHPLCDTALPEPDRRIGLFRVRETAQLKAAGAILNTVFDYSLFSFDKFAEMFENDGQFFYLAECDALPVGAVMAQHGEDFVNISWAGTLPGYRKLGIAGYLIQMAERDGLRRGKAFGALHGYPEIIGAYKRLGYKAYSRATGIEFA